MSKRNRARRKWIVYIDIDIPKGALPYRVNLEKARQSEVMKAYFGQPATTMKVRGCKYARLIKLSRYQAFVDRGTR